MDYPIIDLIYYLADQFMNNAMVLMIIHYDLSFNEPYSYMFDDLINGDILPMMQHLGQQRLHFTLLLKNK